MKDQTTAALIDGGVVSILRGISPDKLMPTVEALYEGGIRSIEITLNTPKALQMIEAVADRYGSEMVVGAGTVLDAPSALSAIHAGAQFVLAPTLDVKTIELCNTYSCACIPGVFTATEALVAWNAGASIVKVFPCSSVGPQYIKDLRGPLPQIKMMAVGGVDLNNTADFYRAGACAVGVGSSLFNSKLAEEGNFAEFTTRAQAFLQLAAQR